ncbi:LOW QUALITY PROTEIN: myomegalin [Electrophorus electricus]|uniref:LOW QUALITY PROTEIN: myomegalin n=1 Tax=Electrophorus electricus TaxID=8005 RepID=UPI0015D0B0CE|nr:LOW QUALITY PROTEIN: myomegalin [Electrophorus electricus]
MLDSKTKELCRVCGRELCGNQRRWIFHPAAKLSLQVLLSHALGWELTRDGRGEFVCSKCAFMLDRMYRFDTVIARVEALSIERMHKLLMEKDRLRQCIGGLYRKNNAGGAGAAGTEASVLDVSVLSDGRYGSLLEEDLTYSVYESWAEHESHSPHRCYARSEVSWVQRSRKCRGCAALRVADSDYEAICKVPRKVGRTMSSGPSTHHSTTVLGSVEDARSGSALQPEGPDPESPTLTEISRSVYTPQAERTSLSPATSDESLDTGVDAGPSCPVVPADLVQGEMEEGRVITQNPGANQKPRTGDGGVLELALSLVQSLRCHPVQVPAGSRLPVPIRPVSTSRGGPVPLPQTPPTGTLCPFSTQPEDMVSVSIRQEMQLDLAEMEELWLDDYVQFRPPDLRKKLIGEQLGQCEAAAGQCVSELQKAQQEVHCLQTKNREASSKNLQQRLSEMDCELRAVREAAHRQERSIQNLNECLNTRNSEVADLQKLTEEQKELLCSLKQQNLQEQLQAVGEVPGQLQAELLELQELQASLFSTQLELQAAQRAQRHAQRREEDLARTNQRLLADLQGALHQQQEVEKHKQDLLAALERARSDLEQTQERWRKGVEEKERETEGKQERIRELQTSLHHKERLLQDYSELADRPGGNRDVLVHKLKQRLQERDRALERALDEKFMCVEQKEAELRKLQLRLREKERDMEKLRCVLSNNEETITSLEALLRGKALELEQVCEAWRSSQRAQRDSEDIHTHGLRERDTLISQLKTAVHTHTEEVKELKAAMLSKVPVGSAELVEVLRSQLQLKDRLFQELLANCSRNAQEHHAQVQDLLNAIRSRDQYIKDSAVRAGHVMSEQAARVQELRRQVLSAPSAPLSITEPSAETQSLQEDLRLLLAREREAQSQISTLRSTLTSTQDQLHAHASELEALTRTVSIKDEIIKDLQGQLLKPPSDPLVKRLTQDLQELRERVSRQDASCPKHEDNPDSRASLEAEQAVRPQAASGDFTSDDEEEEDDYSSEFSDSMEEENSRLTAQSLTVVQDYERCGGPAAWPLSQGAAAAEDQGLAEVKLLVDQKKAVERELCELRAQLEKAGFSSFSQMRKALISLRSENEELRSSAGGREGGGGSAPGEEEEERRGEDSSVAKPQAYEGRKGGARPLLSHTTQDHTEHDSGPVPLSPMEAGLRERTVRLTSDLQQEQQERPLVSEDRVQAQAEQLGDHRDLLTEVSVQQDSKQVQVDLQDLGYETCGRSENEAERDGASSPEFDDLNLCTSLSCGDGTTQWWLSPGAPARVEGEAAFLRRLVEDLRGQLSRSQALACSLKARVDGPPASTPRKVNWGVDSLRAQDGAEEDEGWQSSDGGSSLPCRARLHGGLRQLVARVTSLEEQLQRGKNHMDEDHSTTWPGKFDTLIQAQARELSHLRQRLSEGRSLCHILTQHLGNTTKAFEELLRANDVDYYMGQGFREQLGQSSALAQRVSAKISSRDHSQLPDDKTGHELLAFRLSKELQQKEKVIETLRSKLEQEQSRPETPGSSHAVSEGTDQSEQMSFVSDEQGSIKEELDVSSDLDAASQFSQEEATEKDTSDCHSNQSSTHSHPLMMPSLTSSHDHRSSSNCPSIHCTPHRLMEGRVPTGLSSAPFPQSRPTLSAHPASLPFDPQSQHLRPRYCGNGGFSLAEVQQELQMLQRQFGNSVTGSSVKPLPGYPVAAGVQPTPCGFHPLSQHAFHQAPLASLSASPGSRLLENSALWDMTYGAQQMRGNVCGDVSSGSSGYPSGQHHTGAGWMETNLRDIRSLHRRLEDSIQTNDGLRRQLEARLTTTAPDGGAPTNIYIQGLDSVTQLSRDVQALKEENCALHDQLQQARRDGMKEAEQLREALQSGRGRWKQAEAEAERWAGQCRQLQEQVLEQTQAVLQLKRDRQDSQENADRLQHEVNVLQNQLSESRRLAHTLQGEGQVYQRARSSNKSVDAGAGLSLTFDLQESQSHLRMLEKQLSDRLDLNMPRPSARKQFFHDVSCSPPVRDTGLFGPNSHLPSGLDDPQSGFLEPCLRGREGEACRTGCHVMGHEDNFNTLQQAVLEAKVLIRKMETALQQGCGRSLLSSTKLLKQVLEEMGSVLGTFWGASLPSAGTTTTQHFPKDKSLKEEVVCLKRKLLEQDQVLREALDSLRSSNRTKDSMEQFIVSQLSQTRDVLKRAHTNLEKNKLRISSLGSASSPLSSTSPWSSRGEVPTITCTSSCGWGNVTPPPRGPKRGTSDPWSAPRSGMYRPLEVVGGSVLPGLRAAVSPLC